MTEESKPGTPPDPSRVGTTYRFIHFDICGQNPRTWMWRVIENKTGAHLGFVHWYWPWRQYAYHCPLQVDAEFSAGCLSDISEFCRAINKERGKTPDGGS